MSVETCDICGFEYDSIFLGECVECGTVMCENCASDEVDLCPTCYDEKDDE